jgi:hypothetical protein
VFVFLETGLFEEEAFLRVVVALVADLASDLVVDLFSLVADFVVDFLSFDADCVTDFFSSFFVLADLLAFEEAFFEVAFVVGTAFLEAVSIVEVAFFEVDFLLLEVLFLVSGFINSETSSTNFSVIFFIFFVAFSIVFFVSLVFLGIFYPPVSNF